MIQNIILHQNVARPNLGECELPSDRRVAAFGVSLIWRRELRQRTLDLICCRDDIYEYYHPVSGENPPNAASMFGWSSAVFIDLAIQAAREKSQ